jgi:hypothetical protein
MFEGVISPLLIVMQRCLESGDDDVVAEGLELIQTCTAMEQPLVNDHIRSIISFTVQIIGNAELESATRNASHQTMLRIIQLRPKLLARQTLVQPLLEVFVQAIANSDSSGNGTLYTIGNRRLQETDDDEDATGLREIAQYLDKMALSLTSRSFSGPVFSIVSRVCLLLSLPQSSLSLSLYCFLSA